MIVNKYNEYYKINNKNDSNVNLSIWKGKKNIEGKGYRSGIYFCSIFFQVRNKKVADYDILSKIIFSWVYVNLINYYHPILLYASSFQNSNNDREKINKIDLYNFLCISFFKSILFQNLFGDVLNINNNLPGVNYGIGQI